MKIKQLYQQHHPFSESKVSKMVLENENILWMEGEAEPKFKEYFIRIRNLNP
ncbi:hypothetical protein ACRN9T_19080 [Shewanella baltica]|uniref:hypothetical protein n=1 Tax=Shewanella baltica TaxID=62322 RepID=UPI003D7ADD9B